MAKASRAHANFAEYVPLTIILIGLLEQAQFPSIYLHLLGALLVLGRVIHAYGISKVHEDFRFRVLGMALTFMVILAASLSHLVSYLF